MRQFFVKAPLQWHVMCHGAVEIVVFIIIIIVYGMIPFTLFGDCGESDYQYSM